MLHLVAIMGKTTNISITKDLHNLESWARMWHMIFDAGKCKVMFFGPLGDITEEKELGVSIGEIVKFDHHSEAQVGSKQSHRPHP